MKKYIAFISFFCVTLLRAQGPNICANFYAVTGNSAYICSTGIPNSSTFVPIAIPPGANGMALGSSFGFLAPNPTLWTVIGGTYWYFNGSTFVNSTHFAGLGALNPGGSINYIYNITMTGQVTRYNGIGNATPVTSFTIPNFLVSDVVGDDQDNFYLLRQQNPQMLGVYNSAGVLTCSYSVSGMANSPAGGALAIIDNTVTVQNQNGYYVGIISGGAVSFTQTALPFTNVSDFANCFRNTAFSSGINPSVPNLSCLITTLALTASASPTININNYNWSGPSIIGATNQPSIQVAGVGVYNCTITSCEGATSISAYTVSSLITNPLIVAQASKPAVCVGDSVTLSASGASTYTWLPINAIATSTVVFPTTNSTYTVIGQDANGCLGSDTISVMLNVNPTITAVASPTSLCSGGSATLTASGTAGVFNWEPGNLQGVSVVVSPGSTTIYTVTTAMGSCTAMATATVYNPTSPQLITSGNTLTCVNPTAQLIVLPGSVNDTIAWFGPGIISPNNSTTLNVNVAGTYTLVVTNTLANCVSIDSVKIFNQINPIQLNIVSSATQVCYPGNTTVTMQINSPSFITWSPNLFINTTTGPLVTVTPSTTTTYTVLGVLGACTGIAAITISVNTTPTVLASLNNPTICAGQILALSASGAANYFWLPGNLSGSLISVSANQNIKYVVTGESGNCFSSDTVRVNVLPSPLLTPTVWPVLMCPGNNATLKVSDATSYTWQPGGANGSSITVTPSVTTSYTVTGSNTLGCSSSSVVTVSLYQAPTITALASSSAICVGDSVQLQAQGANSFTWFPGNITGTAITVSPFVTSNYTVVATNTACSSERVVSVNVSECVTPVFGITNAADKPQPENQDMYRIDFTVTAVNSSLHHFNNVKLKNDLKTTFTAPCTYSILVPPSLVSKNSKLVVNPFYDGTTDVDLIKSDLSEMNASKRDTVVFSVLLEPKGFYGRVSNFTYGSADYLFQFSVSDTSNNGLVWDPDGDGNPANNNELTPIDVDFINFFIPEGFSPNGDDNNDLFEIKGLYGRPVKLTVFNRWGNKVYEKSNYDNSWDGRVNVAGLSFGNGKLPQSTYYYILQFLDGRKETKAGFVVLQY
ncbi:MAG: gliding motility-associated C-terminal domain-containing protein [Bacteroidia bacterium]|nr:gliding motility-associated C-terminal domain-containing protein [Bacteroidia bacterium]